MALKNIIFDLGGVLLKIDYERTAAAFVHLGFYSFEQAYSQAKQNQLFDRFEKGEISTEEFCETIRILSNKPLMNEEIKKAWNAMILEFPAARVDWLMAMKKHYRLFLLSNTNRIHVDAFTQLLDANFGINMLESVFEKVYLSCDIGMRKPDAEIFEFVLNENKLQKDETLFIDDSIQHINGAKAIGLNAVLLEKEKEVESLFIDYTPKQSLDTVR
ncbi:MAG TPA: HAD family phosphatase [Bacteroidia bacterium]|nr:HAD family phosphatase [Bacteroidia bacterium]HNT79107.1 HAD family phosphatase [Bacteroidia bacterium]